MVITVVTALFSLVLAATGLLVAAALSMNVLRRADRDRKIHLVIRRGSVELRISASGDFREVNRILGEVLSSIESLGDTAATLETSSAAESAFAVVRAYNQVERSAAEFVSSLTGDSTSRSKRLSVFEMQRVIQQEGIWSPEDNLRFRNLVQLRNSIVHEDGHLNRSANDLQQVVADANRLTELLRKGTKAQDPM